MAAVWNGGSMLSAMLSTVATATSAGRTTATAISGTVATGWHGRYHPSAVPGPRATAIGGTVSIATGTTAGMAAVWNGGYVLAGRVTTRLVLIGLR